MLAHRRQRARHLGCGGYDVIWRTIVALAAGLVMSLAFPPVGFGPYAIVAVALLTWTARGQRAGRGFLYGFLTGIVFFAAHMFWMTIVGTDAWILLAAYCALWIGLVGWGTALVTRLPGWPLWVGALWVLSEAIRGRFPFGGYPWGRLAFSQAGDAVSEWSYLLGMAGLTFVIAFCGAAIVAIGGALTQRRTRAVLAWSIPVALIVVVPVLFQPSVDGSRLTVALVQGGTPQLGLGALDVRQAVLENHVRETVALGAAIDRGEAPRPEFVLWPENSSDLDPFTDSTAAGLIDQAADAVGVPILVGAVIDVPDDPNVVQNVGIWWDPQTGPGRIYVKTRPVPFGEFIPFRAQLADLIGRFDRIPRDFMAGSQAGLFPVDGAVIGDGICFEVAYDAVMHELVTSGATVLTIQTNNATYGNTAQPEQQFDISLLRAIEHGRSVVVASTTGISAAIAPNGDVLTAMGEGEVGYRVADVPVQTTMAPSGRIAPWLEGLLVGAAVLAVIVAMAGRRLGFGRD